jgi:hypothetical protein
VTTSVVHGLTSGDVVEITGAVVNTNINGIWVATVTSTTVFTVPVSANGVGTAGGVVSKQMPDTDVNNSVSICYNSIAGILPTD